MKKILATVLIYLLFSSTARADDNTQYCVDLSEIGRSIMVSRQMNRKAVDMFNQVDVMKTKFKKSILKNIIRAAYFHSVYRSGVNQKAVAERFYNDIFIECIRTKEN